MTTRSLRTGQLRAVRVTSSERRARFCAPLQAEKAYVLCLQLSDAGSNEFWKAGAKVPAGPFGEGSIVLSHLESQPAAFLKSPFDALLFHLPEVVLDELADDDDAPRVGDLTEIDCASDPVIHHLGRALLPVLDRAGDGCPLFFDHLACAFYSRVASEYGRRRRRPLVHGICLSPSQERTAKALMTADLSTAVDLRAVAAACGMPVGRFIRAFRQSAGVPPFRWLRGFRVERAQELLFSSPLSLAAIAFDCGFSDQSHFTRVFTSAVGMPPGAWRRARRH